MYRIIPMVVMTGLLAACGTYAPPGSTAEFGGGYTNGCQNGYEDGGRTNHWAVSRDELLYGANAEYKEGWDAGYAECFDRAISNPYGEGGARP
ncbi:MAG: hypothetical protein GY791_02290 [Alphaproteobacteria bacterium]|nr:hypothetical protein [Alphaproteobacteria bacterium]